MSLRAVASLQSMLSKSQLSCKSPKVHSGCSATHRKAYALEGRPEAAPKVIVLTETADSGCEGIDTPSVVGSVRTGDTWRVCAEAAAEAAPGD
eukprot:5394196-Pyramimonas_sp.AAC.1